jgi:hypothetical protein
MTTQYLKAGGALDVLTKSELDQSMGHHFDAAIRDLLRGVDYLQFSGQGNGASTFTIPYSPGSGYSWSVKLISAQISTAGQLSVYLSENIATAPLATVLAATNGSNIEAVARWSSEQFVIKDGREITLYCSAGNILSYHLSVKQVPTEMQGKL